VSELLKMPTAFRNCPYCAIVWNYSESFFYSEIASRWGGRWLVKWLYSIVDHRFLKIFGRCIRQRDFPSLESGVQWQHEEITTTIIFHLIMEAIDSVIVIASKQYVMSVTQLCAERVKNRDIAMTLTSNLCYIAVMKEDDHCILCVSSVDSMGLCFVIIFTWRWTNVFP